MIVPNTHQPIGACALLMNTDGKVLLGKRKNSYKSGLYGLPGGRIELNEPIMTAIHRELLEETGLDIPDLEYVGVVRENQSSYDFIHFIFVAKNISQEPILTEPEKCEGWEWLDPANQSLSILPGHAAAVELYLKNQLLSDVVTLDK